MELYLVWKWPYCLQVTALWSTRSCLYPVRSSLHRVAQSNTGSFFFFFKYSFLHWLIPHHSSVHCVGLGWGGGVLTQARKWSLVINKWVSTSYWQSQGAEDQVHLAKRNAQLQSSAKVWSILTPRPSSLPKFKADRHLPFEAHPINTVSEQLIEVIWCQPVH